MTIEKVTMYRVVCNSCGQPDIDADYYAWSDAESAEQDAREAGWFRFIGDRHICHQCFVARRDRIFGVNHD